MSGTNTKFNSERLMVVLLAPQVSEKSTLVGEKDNQYVFRVAADASKPEIKAAVELMFKKKSQIFAGSQHQRQGKALRSNDWSASQLEKGLREPHAWRRNHLSGGGISHGTGQTQTDFKWAPRRGARGQSGSAQRKAGSEPPGEKDSWIRTEQLWPGYDEAPGWRTQTALPDHRLQAQQGWNRSQG